MSWTGKPGCLVVKLSGEILKLSGDMEEFGS